MMKYYQLVKISYLLVIVTLISIITSVQAEECFVCSNRTLRPNFFT